MDPRLIALGSGGGSPFIDSSQPQFSPTFNIPGASPMVQMLLQMVLEPSLNSMLGRDWFPTQFFPQNQILTLFRNRDQILRQRAAMSGGLEQDRQIWQRYIRSAVEISGLRWNDRRQQEAALLARDLTPLMSTFAMMMPETYDSFMGPRGSSYVMAGQTYLASRFLRDPVTGTAGMSDASLSSFNRALYRRLFEGDNPAGLRYGFGAGAAGTMVNELLRRGYAPSMVGGEGAREPRLDAPTSVASLLGGLGPGMASGLGAFSAEMAGSGRGSVPTAEQIRMRLRGVDRMASHYTSYMQVLGAVRDAFGDAGMSNPSMEQLINTIESLTQGGLATTSPGDLNVQIRRIQALNNTAGVNLLESQRIAGTLAGLAPSYGFHRGNIPGLVVSVGAARNAYAGLWSGVTSPFAETPEQMNYREMQLRAGAAGSTVARHLAAMVGLSESGLLAPDSEGAALVEALRNNRTTYRFGGRERRVYDANRRPYDIAVGSAAAGINAGDIESYFNNQSMYSQYIRDNRFNIPSLAREMQFEVDVAPVVRTNLERNFGREYVEEIASGLFGRGRLALTPDQTRDMGVVEMARRLVGTPAAAGRTEIQLRAALSNSIGNASAVLEFQGLGPFSVQQRTQFGSYLDRIRETELRTSADALLNDAFSGLNRTSLMSRIVNSVATAGPRTSITDLVASVIGSTRTSAIMGRLGGPLERIRALYGQVRGNPSDTAAVNAAVAEIRRLLEELNQNPDEIADLLSPDAPVRPRGSTARVIAGTIGSALNPDTWAGAAQFGASASGLLDSILPPSMRGLSGSTRVADTGIALRRAGEIVPAVVTSGRDMINSTLRRFLGDAAPQIPDGTSSTPETSDARRSANALDALVDMFRGRRISINVDGNLNLPGFGDLELDASSATMGAS